MKCMDCHFVRITPNQTHESFAHSNCARLCVGEAEYVLTKRITVSQDIGDAHTKELGLACPRSSNHHDWAFNCIDGLFLSAVKRSISLLKGFHYFYCSASVKSWKRKCLLARMS